MELIVHDQKKLTSDEIFNLITTQKQISPRCIEFILNKVHFYSIDINERSSIYEIPDNPYQLFVVLCMHDASAKKLFVVGYISYDRLKGGFSKWKGPVDQKKKYWQSEVKDFTLTANIIDLFEKESKIRSDNNNNNNDDNTRGFTQEASEVMMDVEPYDSPVDSYNFNFAFIYNIMPSSELTVDEVLELIVNRYGLYTYLNFAKEQSKKTKSLQFNKEQLENLVKSLSTTKTIRKPRTADFNILTDVESFWAFYLFVCVKMGNPMVYSWFKNLEVLALKAKLSCYIKNDGDLKKVEEDVNAFCSHIAGGMKFTQNPHVNLKFKRVKLSEEDLKSSEQLFKMTYPDDPIPKIWYAIPWEESLKSVKERRSLLRKGYCIVSYKDIIDYIAETVYVDNVLNPIFSDAFLSKIKIKLAEVLSEVGQLFKYSVKASIIPSFIMQQLPSAQPKVTNIKRENVLDIEECYKSKKMPLCLYNVMERLTETNHLLYQERWFFSSSLFDFGYTPAQIIELFKKYMLKGRMTEQQFHTQIASIASKRRNHKNDIQYIKMDSQATTRQGSSCYTVQNPRHIQSQSCYGCPYKNMTDETKKKLKKVYNIKDDVIDIVKDFSEKGEYSMACKIALEGAFGTFKKTGDISPVGLTVSANDTNDKIVK